MEYITQSEMDNLATMANGVLLPIVNAAVANNISGFPEWFGVSETYDKYAGGFGEDLLFPLNPQPVYSFARMPFENQIPPGAHYDPSGNLTVTIPLSYDYVFQLGPNDTKLHDPTVSDSSSGPTSGFDYVFSTNNFYLLAGTVVTLSGTPNALVTATLTMSPYDWLFEMNRIRGDLMGLLMGGKNLPATSSGITGGEKLFLNPAALVSGPWIVGVNDPDIWPLDTVVSNHVYAELQGVLQGSLPSTSTTQMGFCLFKNVSFYFAEDDAPPGFSVTGSMLVNGALNFESLPLNAVLANVNGFGVQKTIRIKSDQSGLMKADLVIPYSYIGASPPSMPLATGSFVQLTCTGADTSSWISTANAPSDYQLNLHIEKTMVAGTSYDIVLLIEPPGNTGDTTYNNCYTIDLTSSKTFSPNDSTFTGGIDFTTSSTAVNAAGLHPTSQVQKIVCAESGGTHSNLQFGAPLTTGLGFTIVGTDVIWAYTGGESYFYSYTQWAISDPTVKGCWSATTWPVPGINVYLDQDFPPFIGTTVEILNGGGTIGIGVAANAVDSQDGTNLAPWASTMRQAAPIQIGTTDTTLINGVKSVLPSITARPAKWLFRRDTDFVPFELGFNSNLTHQTFSNLLAPASGDLVLESFSVPANAMKVIVRLVKSGTVPGWKAGTFQYGDALASNLTIYAKATGFPTPSSNDFSTTNNAVTIPTDGGAGYLATIVNGTLFLAVQNTTGSDVAFDMYVEIDSGTPQRNYFPYNPPQWNSSASYSIGDLVSFSFSSGGPDPTYEFGVFKSLTNSNVGNEPTDATNWAAAGNQVGGEAYSYVLDGKPGAFFAYKASGYGNLLQKPIPNSGYCIFQVRATRLPTLNVAGISIIPQSGTALTVTIGQNIFNPDGSITFTPLKQDDGVTNITVTIPAMAGTSGDVKVYIPVVRGNEIVYQCDQQVSFEAWVNWQPIFFNKMYGSGQFPYDPSFSFNEPVPTIFQYALSFANDYNVTSVGWTSPYFGATSSAVVFPNFREIYDDMVSLMTLLGAELPGGQLTSGAGGTGTAGGSGNAGDIGAGSGALDDL